MSRIKELPSNDQGLDGRNSAGRGGDRHARLTLIAALLGYSVVIPDAIQAPRRPFKQPLRDNTRVGADLDTHAFTNAPVYYPIRPLTYLQWTSKIGVGIRYKESAP
jgi:hypothetical protein